MNWWLQFNDISGLVGCTDFLLYSVSTGLGMLITFHDYPLAPAMHDTVLPPARICSVALIVVPMVPTLFECLGIGLLLSHHRRWWLGTPNSSLRTILLTIDREALSRDSDQKSHKVQWILFMIHAACRVHTQALTNHATSSNFGWGDVLPPGVFGHYHFG